MSKIYEISLLLDFYGRLLTERQVEVLDLHYNQDLSLGEISDSLDISRQAIHDAIKKGRERLITYEQKLGLAERFLEKRAQIGHIVERLDGMIGRSSKSKELKEIQKELESLAESL